MDSLTDESAGGSLDFVVVLSAERTGGTSVFQSLKPAVGEAPLLHVHFFDGDRYRGAADTEAKAAFREVKRQREAQAKAFLFDPERKGVVFTVLRDRLSRVVSSLWFAKRDVLMRRYDRELDAFWPRTLRPLQPHIDVILDKETSYGREVFEPLGLPAQPAPGRYRTHCGARVFALDFARLEQDFAAATGEVFGRPVPLLHVNGGEMIGDARGYAAFRRHCAQVLTPQRLGLVP